MLENQSALVKIAQTQSKEGQDIFNIAAPGLAQAEEFYQALERGDPASILKATAPATQQITEATEGAKRNILMSTPPGGEKNLAIENADVAQGANIAKLTSSAVANAPNALAQLAGQGVGESISAAGTGISGLSAASQTLSSLGNLQLEGQKLAAEQKGSVLGSVTSMAQTGMEVGALLAL